MEPGGGNFLKKLSNKRKPIRGKKTFIYSVWCLKKKGGGGLVFLFFVRGAVNSFFFSFIFKI